MKTFQLSSSLITIALLGVSLQGESYYVSPNGIDSAAGSDLAPFRTISRAVLLAKPGDVIYVAEGSYKERVATARDGTSTTPITLRGPTRGSAEVDQFRINHSWIRVEGFTVLGNCQGYQGGINIAKTVSNVFVLRNTISSSNNVYGINLAYSGVLPEGAARDVVIMGNTIKDCKFHGLNLRGVNHLVCSNNFTQLNGWDAMRVFGKGHRIIKNSFVNVSQKDGNGNHVDMAQTFGDNGDECYDILFEGNTIKDCVGQGVRIEAHGVANIRDWRIVNNVFVNVMFAVVTCGADRCMVLNNAFINCTTNTAHAVQFFDSANGLGSNGYCSNNLFIGCGDTPNSSTKGWFYGTTERVNLTLQHDCNFVSGPAPAFAPKKVGTDPTWNFRDEHGVNGGDPMFRSWEAQDFRLAKGSQLIDKGMGIMLLGAITADLESKPRGMGAGWDIGAYEFGDEPAPVSGVTVE